MLGYWKKCWNVGILEYWDTGINTGMMRCWNTGMMGWWNAGTNTGILERKAEYWKDGISVGIMEKPSLLGSVGSK